MVFNRIQGSIYWKIPPPPPGGISRCHLGKKYERGREIGGKCKKKEERGKKKEEKGKTMRNGEVKG